MTDADETGASEGCESVDGEPVRTFDSLPAGPLSPIEYKALEAADEFDAAPLVEDSTDGRIHAVSLVRGDNHYHIGWDSDDEQWVQIVHIAVEDDGAWEIDVAEIYDDETGELQLGFEADEETVVEDVYDHIWAYFEHHHDDAERFWYIPDTAGDIVR